MKEICVKFKMKNVMSCHKCNSFIQIYSFIAGLFKAMDLQLEIVHAKSNKPLVTVYDVLDTFTVQELKKYIASKKSKYKDINRQELRLEPKGKPLKDELTLKELGIKNESIIYFKVTPL